MSPTLEFIARITELEAENACLQDERDEIEASVSDYSAYWEHLIGAERDHYKALAERRGKALKDWPCLSCKRNSPDQPDYNPEQFEIDHQYDTQKRGSCLKRRAALAAMPDLT